MYKAVLFAPDGDWVTDHRRETVEEVQEALNDQGSRWYFYPFHAVIRAHGITRKTNRLVDVAPPFEDYKGRTIRTFAQDIAATDEDVLEDILRG